MAGLDDWDDAITRHEVAHAVEDAPA
jgi:hypothetical protein